jgi:hypothetical protein
MSVLSVVLRTFVPTTTSFGWAWGPWQGNDPMGQEDLSDISELQRVLRSYATTVAMMLRPADSGDRFNVTAYGAGSNLVYGRDQWLWVPDAGHYQEHGKPWVPREVADAADLDRPAPVFHMRLRSSAPGLAA